MSGEKLGQEATDIARAYEPTPEERTAREAVHSRRKTPRVKVSQKERVVNLSLDHPDQSYGQYLLMEALGTLEPDFAEGILRQLCKAATQGQKEDQKVDEQALNFMVSVMKGVRPKDQLETMLAMQMAAVHMLTIDFAWRLNSASSIPQQDSAERALNKLARTFVAQVEALKRYRSSGEQKVRVEHVTVNEGGQAIVGTVTHRGAGSSEKPG
jgi:hypothetical protein